MTKKPLAGLLGLVAAVVAFAALEGCSPRAAEGPEDGGTEAAPAYGDAADSTVATPGEPQGRGDDSAPEGGGDDSAPDGSGDDSAPATGGDGSVFRGCDPAPVIVEQNDAEAGTAADASGADASEDGEPACPVYHVPCFSGCCGGQCVDLTSDLANCGSCGNACGGVAICSGGACACLQPFAVCGGVCVDLQTDARNCGACGNPCQSGCAAGACLPTPTVLACGGTLSGEIALSGSTVGWVNGSTNPPGPPNGTVAWVPTGGSASGAPTPIATGLDPRAIATDGSNVYWTEVDAVKRAPLRGGPVTTIATIPAGFNFGLAVDASHAYVASAGATVDSGTILAVALSDGAVTTLATGGGPSRIAVDGTSVYWTDSFGGAVMKMPLGGGPITTLASGQATPVGIALDATSVYWTAVGSTIGTGAVMKAPLGGGAVTTLAAEQAPGGDLVVDATSVYFIVGAAWHGRTYFSGAVAKIPLTGGAVTTLALGQSGPTGLAVDGTSVYWTDTNGNYGSGTLYKLPK